MKDEVIEMDEELDEEAEESEEESDDDLTYDEDGNIVIDEDEEADDDSDEDEEEADEDEEEEADEDDADADDGKETTPPANDNDEVARLRARIDELERQGRDTLKRLGASEQTDVMKGLAELAAEAEGLTPEEYANQQHEQERKAEAERLLKQVEFERKAAADLVELKSNFPELASLNHVRDLPTDVRDRFARYRDLGLSAKEAYAAANPDGIRQNVATAVKRQGSADSKKHLKSSVPRAGGDSGVSMTRQELAEWREMFPGRSDKYIMRLFKETAEKE